MPTKYTSPFGRRSYVSLSKAQRAKRRANRSRIWQQFNQGTLRRVCEANERDLAKAYGMQIVDTPQWHGEDDFFAFKDNGSRILAVAHLDTVVEPEQRKCGFLDTADGLVVYSGALDDRLGAYIILELLPRLGINVDVLLTTGEERGQSTAARFDPPPGKDYNWIIEFDRGSTDVVMYQYEDDKTAALVEDSGAPVGTGSFSDIAYLEHLCVKAFNWGVGYEDYHGPRSHAFLDDTWNMLSHFMDFHAANAETLLPHEEKDDDDWSGYVGGGAWGHLHDDERAEQLDEDDERADSERKERRLTEMTDAEWEEYCAQESAKVKAALGALSTPLQPPLPLPPMPSQGDLTDDQFELQIAHDAASAVATMDPNDEEVQAWYQKMLRKLPPLFPDKTQAG